MAVAKKQTKVIKKRWFPILATKLFNEAVIGETTVDETQKMIGKVVSISMMNLTGDIKKQSNVAKFKVVKVEHDKAYTEFVGYEIQPSAVRRMVKRGKNKIDQSFVFSTADGKKVVIKVIMITNFMANLSVLTDLRNKNQALLKEAVSKLDYNKLVEEIVMHKLQGNIKKALHKIYPLRVYEIRHFSIFKEVIPEESAEKIGAAKAEIQ